MLASYYNFFFLYWSNQGRNNIEGLVLDLTTSTDGQMTISLFERMPNLRLLRLINARDIKGNFSNLFPKLRCIRWHSCPWTHIPSTFHPQNLISMDMPMGRFKILWKGPVVCKLRCIRWHSFHLMLIFIYSFLNIYLLSRILTFLSNFNICWLGCLKQPIKQLNHLSCLYLSQCRDLKRLPEQLGDMKTLQKINASFTAIKKLPESITHLKDLIELNLRFCKKLKKFPEQFGELKGLKKLNAGHSAIEQLPDSITQLKELLTLYLFGSKKLRKLPEQIGNMEGLRTFHASNSALEQLPDSFSCLINLERLYLSECKNLANLPNSIWQLKSLKVLHLESYSSLVQLPEHSGMVQCSQDLHAYRTSKEEVPPDSIGQLRRLQVLGLGCKKLEFVP